MAPKKETEPEPEPEPDDDKPAPEPDDEATYQRFKSLMDRYSADVLAEMPDTDDEPEPVKTPKVATNGLPRVAKTPQKTPSGPTIIDVLLGR